ncbi:MAG: GGDEF domain-containing protein [Lachnospiraceae bacterium]|nr:GGDEF domain-containing protein [Lachnospiraceae bacterium]
MVPVTYLLPDRQHAISGMLIMNLIFVCAGFAAPFSYSTIGHCLLVVDIALANTFMHYENLDMMYMFNIPAVISVCVIHNMMQRVYLEHYITKGQLENLVVRDQLTNMYNRNKMKELSVADTGELAFADDLDVIRWGGEEFLIVMPGCDSVQAMRVAEKIREKVEKSDNGICKMTISIGVALYKGGDYHETMKMADDAMYQAKAEGRNRIELYK